MKNLPIVLILLLLIPERVCAQSNRTLQKQWNFREKDRLLEYVSQQKPYKGIFFEELQVTSHELVPNQGGIFNYRIMGEYLSYSCDFNGTEPEAMVAKMMAIHQEPYACKSLDAIASQSRGIMGYQDDRWVGLVQYAEGESPYYQLHYISKNGFQDPVDDTRYTDRYPLAKRGSYLLLLDKSNAKAYVTDGKREIELSGVLSEALASVERSYGNRPDLLNHFAMDGTHLYLPVSIDSERKLAKVSLKNGANEWIRNYAINPVIRGNQLYYLVPDKGPQGEPIKNSGLFKRNIKSGKEELVFGSLLAEELNFKWADYVPLSDNKLLIVGGRVYILDLDKVAELSNLLNQAYKADQEFYAYRESNRNAILVEEAEMASAEAEEVAVEEVAVEEVAVEEVAVEELAVEEVAVEEVAVEEVAVEEVDASAMSTAAEGETWMKDEKLEALNRKREELKNAFDQKLLEMTDTYFVPDEFSLLADPQTGDPIFVSERPNWPILQREDLLPYEPEQ